MKIKVNIAQYVTRKDLIGLADYARAIVEDQRTEIEELEIEHSKELHKAFRRGVKYGQKLKDDEYKEILCKKK